nr:MAG TPA: Receptor recognition protein, Long tail, Helical sandwich, Tail fiber [Caudoviricetes sp.]
MRYEEFIALNTWQIQKLKQRVTELENEIKEIKQNENN